MTVEKMFSTMLATSRMLRKLDPILRTKKKCALTIKQTFFEIGVAIM